MQFGSLSAQPHADEKSAVIIVASNRTIGISISLQQSIWATPKRGLLFKECEWYEKQPHPWAESEEQLGIILAS